MTVMPKENIYELPVYIPGKPIDEVKREYGLDRVVKLASNENPLGPSPKAIKAIEKTSREVNLYPDGSAFEIKNLLADFWDVNFNQLCVSNGSDETIHLLSLAFLNPGDEAIIPTPSFPMYKIAIQAMNGVVKEVGLNSEFKMDLDKMAQQVTDKTKLIFLCNPNNPTGTISTRKEIDQFIEKLPPHVLVVFDEAYFEYVDDPDFANGLDYVKKGVQGIVLRTFSKAYGLAGLRVGYSISSPEIADILNRVRSPFNVNIVGQAAAAAAIGDQEYLQKVINSNQGQKQFLYQEFAKMELEYLETQANFILVNVTKPAATVFEGLLKKGIIVRGGFGLDTWIRVTVGTSEENELFIAALKEVLS